LCGKFEEHFVTAAYLFVDLEKGIWRYAAAGHPPLLLFSKKVGSAVELEENGLMLGLFPEAAYSYAEFRALPELAVCFTPTASWNPAAPGRKNLESRVANNFCRKIPI